MTPESIVVSLEIAKKLKEAGWPQEDSLFNWIAHRGKGMAAVAYHKNVWKSRYGKSVVFGAAPTAEDILRKLPNSVTHWMQDEEPMDEFFRTRAVHEWSRGISCSLADAAAEKWLYLKQNRLIDVDSPLP